MMFSSAGMKSSKGVSGPHVNLRTVSTGLSTRGRLTFKPGSRGGKNLSQAHKHTAVPSFLVFV